jgi:hypothetical protein
LFESVDLGRQSIDDYEAWPASCEAVERLSSLAEPYSEDAHDRAHAG